MAISTTISFEDFYTWFLGREPDLAPQDKSFSVYMDAYDFAEAFLEKAKNYFKLSMFRLLIYHLAGHYIITQYYSFTDEEGITRINPLYSKYNVSEASKGIVNSASDESSSASLQITDAMQQLDYFGMDLISTPYGKFVYSMLAQITQIIVRL